MNPFSIAIDVVFVAVFVISIVHGINKGFVRMALSLVALVVSWTAADRFAPAASQWINENFIRENAVEFIGEKLAAVFESGSQKIIEAVPDYIIKAAELADISLESVIESAADPFAAAENIFSACETTIVLPVLDFLMFIVIFIILNIIFALIVRIADKIFDLPVLKKLNKVLGAVAGAVKGLCCVGVLGVILNMVKYIFADSKVTEAINGSYIQNYISLLIEKI